MMSMSPSGVTTLGAKTKMEDNGEAVVDDAVAFVANIDVNGVVTHFVAERDTVVHPWQHYVEDSIEIGRTVGADDKVDLP